MIHQIASEVYRLIREYGGLSQEDVARAIDRQPQVVWRWEKKEQKQLPNREQETILVQEAQLTQKAFGEIMCLVLSKFLERRVTVAYPDDRLTSQWLFRAAKLYSHHRDHLSPEDQKMIEEMLCHGRSLDATAEQTCRIYEKIITSMVTRTLAAKGLSLPIDDDH